MLKQNSFDVAIVSETNENVVQLFDKVFKNVRFPINTYRVNHSTFVENIINCDLIDNMSLILIYEPAVDNCIELINDIRRAEDGNNLTLIVVISDFSAVDSKNRYLDAGIDYCADSLDDIECISHINTLVRRYVQNNNFDIQTIP
jgi:DNA-binding response OmpR family regulator